MGCPLRKKVFRMNQTNKPELSDYKYIKLVPIGSMNPNSPLSDQDKEKQVELLNRCLNDYPKGVIIAKDIGIGRYQVGEHELTMEKITYHVGFARKPAWETEGKEQIP